MSYFEGALDLVESMERALQNGNAEELLIAAHTMKTNNSMVGAVRMAETCIDLRQKADQEDLITVKNCLPS